MFYAPPGQESIDNMAVQGYNQSIKSKYDHKAVIDQFHSSEFILSCFFFFTLTDMLCFYALIVIFTAFLYC